MENLGVFDVSEAFKPMGLNEVTKDECRWRKHTTDDREGFVKQTGIM